MRPRTESIIYLVNKRYSYNQGSIPLLSDAIHVSIKDTPLLRSMVTSLGLSWDAYPTANQFTPLLVKEADVAIEALGTPLPLEGNPRMMPIAKGNPITQHSNVMYTCKIICKDDTQANKRAGKRSIFTSRIIKRNFYVSNLAIPRILKAVVSDSFYHWDMRCYF